MKFHLLPLTLASLFSVSVFASDIATTTRDLQDQEIGIEICSCAPNSYEFTLDFALTCPPVNITLGDAVAATTCMVSPFGDPEVSDLVPISVSSVDVLELNQNLQVINQENIGADFLDGDTFSYISYAAIPGMTVNPVDLPRAIQLNIVGKNKDGDEIINVYLITFTNSCGAYPVLSEGQFAGWTRFSDLGPPNKELCPAAPAPITKPPTKPPTPIPPMSMSMSMDMGMGMGMAFKDLTIDNFEEFFYDDSDAELREKGKVLKSATNEKGGKGSKSYSKSGKKDGTSEKDKGSKGSKGYKSEPVTKKKQKEGKKETTKLESKGSKSYKAESVTKKKLKESKKETTKLRKSEKDSNKSEKENAQKVEKDARKSSKKRLRI